MQFMEMVAKGMPTIKRESKMHRVLCRNEATETQRHFWVQFGTMQAPAKTL
jgi:hypothetical protein